ncbi:MAG TPA: GNAT family N-acetyltransferase [Ramlibacter sp.]|nr:GNAT family N-acetyltransferase [Ramlibacter sp.]
MKALLRPARLGDTRALAELLRQLDYPDTEAFLADRLRTLAAHPDAQVQVAEVDGRVLGVIALHFLPQLAVAGDFCRIAYLCVAEGARGLGVGAQLEQFALDQARRRGCDRIELHSSSHRVAAHRFYARQGYRESPKYLVKSAG